MSLTSTLLIGLVVPVVLSDDIRGLSVSIPITSRTQQVNNRFSLNGETMFTHMVLDDTGSRIFAGAINKIFHLDANLKLIEEVTTGPKLDSSLCHAKGCDSLTIEKLPTNNVNKLLIIDPESKSLIACGSVFQGACEKYNTSSILIPPKFISLSIAANDETSSTYAFIGPENYNARNRNNVLYVGTTFTNNGEYRHDVPAISSRNLYDLEFAAFSFSKQSLLRIDVKYRDQFLVKYIYGFNSTDFAYFVIVQKQSHLPGQEEKGYVSRLARICISDENYDSYTEVTLQCTIRNEKTSKLVNYNLIQDAKIGEASAELAGYLGIGTNDNVLVGVFSPSKGISNEAQSKSAVCVYSLQEIEAKFTENIHMCFNGSVSDRNLGYVSGLILDGKCPSAGSTGNVPYFCEVGLKISGVVPIKATACLHFPNTTLTAVALAKTEKHTVAFLGTKSGNIKKILLSAKSTEYESIIVDNGYPILPDTFVSPAGDFLYVLSTSKITKLKIEHCGTYNNCSSCLEAKDPYCGWCSLEKRCTIRRACQQASESSPRWLSIDGGRQCIDFEYVFPDKIPVSQTTVVTLAIRTLPELPIGAKYRCVFGKSEPIDATVTPTGLICATPSILNRPLIPDNSDHVFVPLSVRSSETNKDFVSRNFAFYDCSRHRTCKSCVTSKWECNWCVYQNQCTHNVTTCHRAESDAYNQNNPANSITKTVDHCPRFRISNRTIFLPNKVSKEIVLDVENLPHPQFVHVGFVCIINIEEAKMMVPARVEKNRYVICDKTVYSYEANVGEYKANVTIVWNKNHHVDTTVVTIYKCNILGSHRDHPDCSLCASSHSQYNCIWCGNVCAYKDSCSHLPFIDCPKPRIDMVKPLNGPIEGGTLLTIEGSNLGLKSEDVRGKIRLGNATCELIDYEVSVRIVCRTSPSLVGESTVPISVGNKAGFTESSVRFSYKNIKLEGIYPAMGPQSGGTQLAITGKFLNIGSSIRAALDELPCHINSTQASSTRLTCVTSKSESPRIIRKLTLFVDGANRTFENNPFNYTLDPTIMEIKPLKSFASGGRMITVHGTNMDTIQKPEMIIFLENESNPINKTACTVINSAQIECPSPAIDLRLLTKNSDQKKLKRDQLSKWGRRSLVKFPMTQFALQVGFIMDNVEAVKDLEKHFPNLRSQLLYVDDPKFFEFPNEIKSYKGDTLVIEGENLNLASDETDVNVTIGMATCNVTSLALTQLVCIPPELQPEPTDEYGYTTSIGLPLVVIKVGQTLRFPIGYLRYEVMKSYSFPPEAIAGIVVGICLVVPLFIIILIVYRRKSTQAEREYKRIQIQMDTLESNVRSECKLAFAELQTDITDLTADLESTGIPTLDHKSYVMNVFFPGVSDHPILNDPKPRTNFVRTNYDAAMFQFEQLINNKNFILTFIETLETQKTFNIRDKVSVASLLMIVLMGKMEYATDVLQSLLFKLIEKSVGTKYPQLMLRRTESVVEKMLTNWMALCMYNYLKTYAGSSLFLLYKAIKHQVEKGPVDAITHDARYSLSEERLLREQIHHNVVTIHLIQENLRYEKPTPYHIYQTLNITQEESDAKLQCKVLDCDTISQVKAKIFDALYKNTHYSVRPLIQEMDLEWRHGRGGHLILQDEDLTSKSSGGRKKLNTLSHYGVKDSAVMSLIPRQHETYCTPPCHNCFKNYIADSSSSIILGNGVTEESSNSKFYHLVQPIDEHQNLSKIGSSDRTHKAIPEIFLTRLLSTKGTIQKFVDDFFSTILTANEALPPAIKWLFDLLDEAATRHSIVDPEVIHAWKSNSLPLRFWVNFIKNPDFILDINKTTTVDSCLSVIAQTFMDACSTTEHRLGKDSPSNKLLFAKDIPQYRNMVAQFYSNIRKLPQITDQEMSTALQQLSASQADEFDIIAALKELYIYVSRYNGQIIQALEADPLCKKMHLAHKLENVACTLEGEETSTC